jgi:hypothetical protein
MVAYGLSVLSTGGQVQAATAEGVSGTFRVVYSRMPKGSAEPSFQMKMDGKFWSAGSSFAAETTYPMPGGGNEKVRILVLDQGNKLLLLYPETMNFRRVQLGDSDKVYLKTIPSTVGTYFTATPERLMKDGINIAPKGKVKVNNENLLAYSARLPDGAEAAVAGNGGQQWNLMLYFSPSTRRIRMMRAYTADADVKLFIDDVRHAKVNADRFIVPSGYYEMKPGD